MNLLFVFLALFMIFLLCCGVQALFKDKHQQKIYLAIREAFKSIIQRHMLSISGMDIFDNRLIAIDQKMNKLVIIVYNNGMTEEKCLSLDNLIFCQLVNGTNKKSGCIESVTLALTFRNDPGMERFYFFCETNDDLRDLPSRIKKSKHWIRKIKYQTSINQKGN